MSVPSSTYVCNSCRVGLRQSLRKQVQRNPRDASSKLSEQRRTYTRPTFAPKPVLDLKHMRLNPGLYEQNCIDRNYAPFARNAWRILELHEKLVERQRDALDARKRNNALAKELKGGRESPKGGREAFLREAKELKESLGQFEKEEKEIVAQMEQLALDIPNLSDGRTPVGDEPLLLGHVNGELKDILLQKPAKSHVDIGRELNILDFEGSASTSGWGWYFLKNEGALLEQALIQFALHTAMQRGWQVMTPPSLVYSHIASACGFLPRDQNGETQIYAIQNNQPPTSPDAVFPSLVLAGTAEIPFAGSQANKTLAASSLPLKIIGPSRCYRAEAGARGVDTKGLYRVHEFTKVEMFAWTLPVPQSDKRFDTDVDNSPKLDEEGRKLDEKTDTDADDDDPATSLFNEMLSLQTDILTQLGLHARILEMPSRELGASATRKVDIEVFFPSRRKVSPADGVGREDQLSSGYGEVTSASICGDYQSRRLNTRVKSEHQSKHGAASFAQTVNGTAMAVPRVLAALLENGWDEARRCVVVPDVLARWMPEGAGKVIGGGRRERE